MQKPVIRKASEFLAPENLQIGEFSHAFRGIRNLKVSKPSTCKAGTQSKCLLRTALPKQRSSFASFFVLYGAGALPLW